MKKINADDVPWIAYASPGGKFTGSYKELSLALGAAKNKNQFNGGHPFDLAMNSFAPPRSITGTAKSSTSGESGRRRLAGDRLRRAHELRDAGCTLAVRGLLLAPGCDVQ
jgi:hypothetical protein